MIADNDPAAQSSRSHSAANSPSRISDQWVRFASLTGGQVSAVTTDQVTSPPLVARMNSASATEQFVQLLVHGDPAQSRPYRFETPAREKSPREGSLSRGFLKSDLRLVEPT